MRNSYRLLLLLFLNVNCFAQPGLSKRIILIGNAYEDAKEHHQFLDAIKEQIPLDSNTIVLYLGNNAGAASDTLALRYEAELINHSDARAFFIPGYLDWAKGTQAGYASILAEQRFLKSLNNKHIRFYPGDGCPGPKKVELGNNAIMFIMDSQWWLHNGVKPDIESDCKYRTKEEVLAEIEDIPKDEFDKLILFVTHHPLENTGVHSGTFGLKQHIFPFTDVRGLRGLYLPLPVVGSLYPIASNAVSSGQGMQNREYQSMANVGISTLAGINNAFSVHPNTVFIAAQEHNLQLLRKKHHYYINSGGPGIPTRVRDNKHAVYVKQQQGFTVLELTADKKLRARFYIVSGKTVKEDHTAELLDYSGIPPLGKDTATMPMPTGDSTIASANAGMAKASLLQRIMIGNNYRAEWSAPLKMKVLHLDRDLGGLKITGMGGGHESKSLQLKDANGKKWVFRNSNKNLNAVIPEGFQETIASDYIQDMLSASNPFAALVVSGLEDPLGIVHAAPQVYFVPNDSALGAFRPLFANNVGLMEERKPALNDAGTMSSNEALNKMLDDDDFFTDQKIYLKIRLVDFLIADFDRHHGQYSWGTIDTDNRTLYYPIPKDRDQAFYHNKGLIMGIMRKGDYGFMVNFPYRIRNMENVGITGAYMDMLFTNQLTRYDWQQTIADFTATLTDGVIDSAVRRFPPEIYAIRGPVISAKLKSRRGSIAEKGMDYYRHIAKKVNVVGGNNEDLFRISGVDSGLLVKVYTKDSAGNSALRFSRTFSPSVTKEVRLYGFNGNDNFDIDPSAKSGIRLRIVGGKGDDTFNIRGSTRNWLYDLSTEGNKVVSRSRTTKMFSRNPLANQFQFREPLHNSFTLPLITLGFNAEDGVVAGIGLGYRTQGFRKYPYGSLQRFAASFASNSKAYMVRYKGEFIDVYRHYDLLLNVENYDPVLSNFFGFGNETVRDTAKDIKYYRTRYDYLSADVLFRKRFHKGNVMSVSAGPSVYYYWIDEEPNYSRVLENPASVGLDSAGVYAKKFYAGGKVSFSINTLNTALLPTRGISWVTDFTALQSLNEHTQSYTRLSSRLDVYAELDRPNRLLAALHFGGGHIFSDHFEYFQGLTLGGNNYLRGYRINRFSGSSMAYGSAELKLKLFDFNTHILKGDFGIVGFHDLGRVWMKEEQSRKWHQGYGGGIYLIPFNSLMISALVGCSEEDTLFNLSLGTMLNMVFQGI